MVVGLLSQVKSHRTRRNSHNLHEGRFRLDVRKSFFMERVVRQQNKLPRKIVESPHLEVFQRCVGMAPRDMDY